MYYKGIQIYMFFKNFCSRHLYHQEKTKCSVYTIDKQNTIYKQKQKERVCEKTGWST